MDFINERFINRNIIVENNLTKKTKGRIELCLKNSYDSNRQKHLKDFTKAIIKPNLNMFALPETDLGAALLKLSDISLRIQSSANKFVNILTTKVSNINLL